MWDEEIEKAVLFYVIFESEDFILEEEDFVSSRNQKIVRAINDLKAEKEEVSMLNICSKIKAKREQVLTYLTSLGDYLRTSTPESVYKQLIKMSKKRKLLELLKDSQIRIINDEEDIDILTQTLIQDINKIDNTEFEEKSFLMQVTETVETIEKNMKNGVDYSLYTGITDLDKITCGLHNQELTIIGARPGVGKTTLGLQIAEHIAEKGKDVAIISLEMSDYQVIQKILAKKTRVNSYKMRMGTLEEEDLEKISIASSEIVELPLHLITKIRTLQQIETVTRKLKNKNNLGLLIIDYIQLIKNKGKFNNREQEVADITRTLKLLSLELDIPIIGLCQLNRNASRSEPTLADLRESGSIEQDADNVLFLYKERETENSVLEDVVLKVAKQRAGETGKVYLKFNKANSEFKGVIRC